MSEPEQPLSAETRPEELCPRIKSILVERLFLEGVDPTSIEDEAPFMQDLGLDSVDALELVLGLEQAFDVKLVEQGLEREAFQSVRALAAFVLRRKAEAAADAGR